MAMACNVSVPDFVAKKVHIAADETDTEGAGVADDDEVVLAELMKELSLNHESLASFKI